MIARIARESLALILLAGLASVATWFAWGGPERGEACDPATLEPGQICFAEAARLPHVLWVDARPRALWEKNGFPGSILLTDDSSEDFALLMGEAFESLANAEAVVIYCATSGCGSSEAVAEKIKELEILPPEKVYVLAGGWQSLESP
ncbi:rhodanese-like domain-containing protein [Roseibacillus ishigakijimensis]|uniref:Rhodanese-like domain-containing protein n=1 Tax=Roseibacillus ishigakijimensis TaxID=454146 RepID=A0A934RRD5_9BACT|nr:rhodanese-like domain-containing protein [Roseibacillus ishigakijimensis]MBK1834058.1 rhodanese-like domain-containing protein [Roseibacillus ishigakijimensis]